jgi:murein DD-endopeptidase MepM/ murein hydrolase activator NlpD
VDEKDNILLSINILNESGQAKYLKQAVLKEYLGFGNLTDDFVPGPISELSPAIAPSNGTTNFKGGTYGCTRVLSNPTEKRIKRFSFRCVDVNDSDNGKYYRFHGGVDISLPFGTTIKAILGGEVVKVQINDDDTDGLGSNVIIKSKLKDGTVIYYHYGHLEGSSINIKNKSKIQKGTEFAKTGNTGNISTIGGIESRTIQQHCHLEVYINGLSKDNRVNPKNYLENSLKKIIENYE